MRTINANTRKGMALMDAYNRSNIYDIYDAYERPSVEKVRADSDCRKLCNREGGFGYMIISYNTFAFSVAWRTPEGLRVETAQNSYIVK